MASAPTRDGSNASDRTRDYRLLCMHLSPLLTAGPPLAGGRGSRPRGGGMTMTPRKMSVMGVVGRFVERAISFCEIAR